MMWSTHIVKPFLGKLVSWPHRKFVRREMALRENNALNGAFLCFVAKEHISHTSDDVTGEG